RSRSRPATSATSTPSTSTVTLAGRGGSARGRREPGARGPEGQRPAGMGEGGRASVSREPSDVVSVYRRPMADEEYGNPRLAAIYDALYPDRSDLDAYIDIVAEFHAHCVLDIGSGTGTCALLLAERGLDVTGVEPAKASLDVARAKPGADELRWIHGDATALPPLPVDLATMTANVAPAIADSDAWQQTLRGTY